MIISVFVILLYECLQLGKLIPVNRLLCKALHSFVFFSCAVAISPGDCINNKLFTITVHYYSKHHFYLV